MPFANKFRAMMDLPLPGDTVGDFTVESVEVNDEPREWWGYAYAVRIVVHGPGGKAGVRRALAPLLSKRVTTFSSYGNPYQLFFDRPEVESLGDRRYAVAVGGAGVRIELEGELERFAGHVGTEGAMSRPPNSAVPEVVAYLEGYRAEVQRRVDRYRRRLRSLRP
jgi:hypothetical protein